MRGLLAGLGAQVAQSVALAVSAGVEAAALPLMLGMCLLLAAGFLATGVFWLLVQGLGWAGGALAMGAIWLALALVVWLAWRWRIRMRMMGVPPGAARPAPPPPGAVPPAGAPAPSRELLMAELALTAFREASRLGRSMRARRRKPRPRYEDDLYD